jgi:uncharacterized protein
LPHHPNHQIAYDWFAKQRTSRSILFCRSTQQSFLRLLTSAPLFKPAALMPFSDIDAWKVYDTLLADKRVSFISEFTLEPEAHWRAFTHRSESTPNLWMDAYLAALALSGNLKLVTFDKAFSQYKGLNLLVL